MIQQQEVKDSTSGVNGAPAHAPQTLNGESNEYSPEYLRRIQEKYTEERNRRVRPERTGQYIELHHAEKFEYFTHDPWLPADGTVPGLQLKADESLHFKIVIQGAGYGGLLYAARFVEAGYNPKDIIIIDSAGGFGGTWYWNRYPGLMCDVAAVTYMPLLEETNYMPKHKFSYGKELREHANRIVDKYQLTDSGIFRATVTGMAWDDEENIWKVGVTQEQGPEQGRNAKKVSTRISGDYVVSNSGVLNYPKLPRIAGLDIFKGHQFHTSRWDYNYTGGSQDDQTLSNLGDKVVALVGTGPTTIQVLPELAKWAKKVYVVQRTPAAVDARGQRALGPEDWKKYKTGPGWQKRLMQETSMFVSNDPNRPKENIAGDGFASMPSYSAIVGGPNDTDFTDKQSVEAHLNRLHVIDLPRQERVRKRVDEIVHDPATAQHLKPWYPGWCKRPCFHDEYLQAFNKPNVELVDTEGKGIDSLTENGFVALGKHYQADALVWGTGFAFVGHEASAAGRFDITGRKGLPLAKHFDEDFTTLFGAVAEGFPNLFCFLTSQSGTAANFVHALQDMAELCVYLVTEAERRYAGKKILIEPTREFGDQWAMRCARNSGAVVALHGCTPSYQSREGALDEVAKMSKEEQMKVARHLTWGKGIRDYEKIVEDWVQNGDFKGINVTVVG